MRNPRECLRRGSQIHPSSATSAIITANEPASAIATLQASFIVGLAVMTFDDGHAHNC